MSRAYSRVVQKKLTEAIEAATDPLVIAELANALAKYLPKPKQHKRRKGTPVPIKPKEVNIHDLVAAMEKGRKGLPLTEQERAMLPGEAEGDQ